MHNRAHILCIQILILYSSVKDIIDKCNIIYPASVKGCYRTLYAKSRQIKDDEVTLTPDDLKEFTLKRTRVQHIIGNSLKLTSYFLAVVTTCGYMFNLSMRLVLKYYLTYWTRCIYKIDLHSNQNNRALHNWNSFCLFKIVF